MHTKPLAAGITASLVLIALAGCSTEAPVGDGDDSTFIIGAAVASSGFVADYDQPPLTAMKIWADEVNAAGGIDGRQVEFLEEDTQSEIEGSATAAQALLQQGVDMIVSSCDFDYGGPAATVAQQAGLLSFSLCAASPKFGVQGIGDKAFTPRGSVGTQAAVLADLAIEKGWKNVYLALDQSTSYATGLCSAFEKFLKELGGSVAGTTTYTNTDTSFSSQSDAIANSDADAVIMCGIHPASESLIRQLRASGVDLPLLAGDPFDGTFWTESVPDISNLFAISTASTFGDSQIEGANEFFDNYKAETGSLPIRGDAIYGFVIGQLVQAAIEGSGGSISGADLAAYLEENTVPTLLGDYTYDDATHISLWEPWEILEFDNGQPHSIGIYSPSVEVTISDGL